MKIFLKHITRIKSDVRFFAKTIYNNFIYLKEIPELMHSEEEIAKMLKSPEFIGIFVYDGDAFIGYLVGEIKMLNDNRLVYYISYMYVSQKYRNKSIGKKMMIMIENIVKKMNIKYIVLTADQSNVKLMKFYKNFGYQQDVLLKTNNENEVFSKQIL